MNALSKRIVPVLIAFAMPQTAAAAAFVWSGTADGNWNNAANWDAGIPAGATDTSLVFSNAIQLSTANNIPGGLTLNSLSFGAASGARTITGNSLIFDGTSPSLVSNSTDSGDVRISAPVVLNQTLNITGGPSFDAQLLFTSTSNISGTGGLNWLGGVGFSSAPASFSGLVQISGGQFGTSVSGGLGNTSGVTITSGAAFQLQSGATINKALSLSGPGFGSNKALNASTGGGTWSGPIILATDSSIGAFSNATLSLTGGLALAGNDATIDAGTGSTVVLGGATSGIGDVIKTGAGTLRLNTTPGHGGKIDVLSGSLLLGATNVLPANFPVTLAAGTTMLTGGFSHTTDASALTGSGNIELSLGQTFTVDNSANQTLNTRFTTTGSSTTGVFVLRKAGSGVLTLAGASAGYTGSTQVSAGTLRLGADEQVSEVPASSSNFAPGCFFEVAPGATFDLNGFDETTGALTGGGSVIIPAGSVFTSLIQFQFQPSTQFNGVMSGAGEFRFASQNQTITFTQNQLHTGGTTLLSGGIRAGADGQVGAPGSALTLREGSLVYTSGFTLDPSRPIIADGTNGGVVFDTFATTIGSNIAGPGRFNKSGSGTLTLTGTNTQASGLRVNGGTLEVPGIAQTGSGGAFDFGFKSGFNVTPATLRALGNLSVPASRTTSFVSWTVDTNGFDVTFNQPIIGTNLTKEGAGILRMNTANTTAEVNHVAAILGGTLRYGVNNAVGLGVQMQVASGAVLDLNSFNQTVLAMTSAGSIQLGTGTLTIRNSGIIDGPISGGGAVVMDGGDVLFNVASTFTGGVTVKNGGAALIASSTALGAPGSPILLDNGELGTTTFATAPVEIDGTSNLTIGPGGAQFSAAGQSLVLSAPLSGGNPLRFTGGSSPGQDPKFEVRLTHPANTFTGDVILGNSQIGNDGALGIVADGSLGASSNIIRLGDRFFDGESTRNNRGTLRAFADLTLPATRALVLRSGGIHAVLDTNGFTMTVAGVVSESFINSGLLKTGQGTLLLNGVNTYTGETRVSEGTLGGNGTIRSLTVASSGVISPGQSTGTLHTANVSFGPGSTLALDFSSATTGDQLSVTGQIFLQGDVELALTLGYTVTSENSFLVVLNDGIEPINLSGGQFTVGGTPLGEGDTFAAAGAFWEISYEGGSGNDVTLTVIPEPTGLLWYSLAGLGLFLRHRHRPSRPGADSI